MYPAGRLDTDSEGCCCDDDGVLQLASRNRVTSARSTGPGEGGRPKSTPALRSGVKLSDFATQPAGRRLIDEPANLWPRDPPIRYRAKIPTAWIEVTLREGKNRQVRRMTAHVGFPTLRLVRAGIGHISVEGVAPGTWHEIDAESPWSERAGQSK